MTASGFDLGLNVDVLMVSSLQMELSTACEPAQCMKFDFGGQCGGHITFCSLPYGVGVVMSESDTEVEDGSSAITMRLRIPPLCKSGHMTSLSPSSGASLCTQNTTYFSGSQLTTHENLPGRL